MTMAFNFFPERSPIIDHPHPPVRLSIADSFRRGRRAKANAIAFIGSYDMKKAERIEFKNERRDHDQRHCNSLGGMEG